MSLNTWARACELAALCLPHMPAPDRREKAIGPFMVLSQASAFSFRRGWQAMNGKVAGITFRPEGRRDAPKLSAVTLITGGVRKILWEDCLYEHRSLGNDLPEVILRWGPAGQLEFIKLAWGDNRSACYEAAGTQSKILWRVTSSRGTCHITASDAEYEIGTVVPDFAIPELVDFDSAKANILGLTELETLAQACARRVVQRAVSQS